MTERFAGRLARTFGGFDRTREELPEWEQPGGVEYDTAVQTAERWEQEPDRFPVTRHGYDRNAVDQHLDALEHELAELRERVPSTESISEEIKRIGEQTAAILQVAHEQAHVTRREAQSEADRCLADAAANALAITDDAHQRLRQLDSDTDMVWRERARLIDDVRAVATALISVADEAATRFPAEHEKPISAGPVRATRPALVEAEFARADEQAEEDSFPGLA
jgi:cell division septum initiation protein DivIVA